MDKYEWILEYSQELNDAMDTNFVQSQVDIEETKNHYDLCMVWLERHAAAPFMTQLLFCIRNLGLIEHSYL